MPDPELESTLSQPLPEELHVSDEILLRRLAPKSKDSGSLFALMNRNRNFYGSFIGRFSAGIKNALKAEAVIRGATQKGIILYGMRSKESDKLIGLVTLAPEGDGIYDLGYMIDEDQQGHGYVSASVKSLTSQVFATGGTKLTAATDPNNAKSQAVLERCDFQQVGTDKDGNLLYELLPPV